jgi:hypothetical protein
MIKKISIGATLILVIGIVGYFGVKNYRADKSSQLQTENLLTTQQTEIQNLKSQVASVQSSSAAAAPITKLAPISTIVSVPNENSISSADLQSYLNGVVEVTCWDNQGNEIDTGSGVLMRDANKQVPEVLTNQHVIGTSSDCDASLNGTPDDGDYSLLMNTTEQFNAEADEALIQIEGIKSQQIMGNGDIMLEPKNPPAVFSLNYAIGALPHCPPEMAIGSPVAIIGYPATGMTALQGTDGNSYAQVNQIATIGTISGYDQDPYSNGLPDVNYFVTAQVDAGNSGGAAIAKDSKGLCFLGLPTWVNQGEYANTGIVQSINNVMFSPL